MHGYQLDYNFPECRILHTISPPATTKANIGPFRHQFPSVRVRRQRPVSGMHWHRLWTQFTDMLYLSVMPFYITGTSRQRTYGVLILLIPLFAEHQIHPIADIPLPEVALRAHKGACRMHSTLLVFPETGQSTPADFCIIQCVIKYALIPLQSRKRLTERLSKALLTDGHCRRDAFKKDVRDGLFFCQNNKNWFY